MSRDLDNMPHSDNEPLEPISMNVMTALQHYNYFASLEKDLMAGELSDSEIEELKYRRKMAIVNSVRFLVADRELFWGMPDLLNAIPDLLLNCSGIVPPDGAAARTPYFIITTLDGMPTCMPTTVNMSKIKDMLGQMILIIHSRNYKEEVIDCLEELLLRANDLMFGKINT